MSTSEPRDERPLTFTYDPGDPAITLGGCEWVNYPCGPYDQAPLDGRPDILTFQSAPLENDLEVTGQVFARLWAATDASDTDFTAKLVDVWPDGRAWNVCDGIIRLSHRDWPGPRSTVEPARPYELTIDLWSTSIVFKRGHRVRLDVSSSNFPRFDPNPNTGFDSYSGHGSEKVTARNTIYVESGRASLLDLPVVPRA